MEPIIDILDDLFLLLKQLRGEKERAKEVWKILPIEGQIFVLVFEAKLFFVQICMLG